GERFLDGRLDLDLVGAGRDLEHVLALVAQHGALLGDHRAKNGAERVEGTHAGVKSFVSVRVNSSTAPTSTINRGKRMMSWRLMPLGVTTWTSSRLRAARHGPSLRSATTTSADAPTPSVSSAATNDFVLPSG